ncbi:hypothetical protein HK102_013195, partial [Quaeritorhiza haematococci]
MVLPSCMYHMEKGRGRGLAGEEGGERSFLWWGNPTLPPIVRENWEYRTVAPGSQPTYVPPRNTDVANNYYFTRDARRSFPQTVVYTADECQKLIAGETVK